MSARSPSAARPPSPLWRPERLLLRRYWVVVALLGAGVVANEFVLFRSDLRRWDWLLVTGFATLLCAAYSSLLLPDKVDETLTRLADRGALLEPPSPGPPMPSEGPDTPTRGCLPEAPGGGETDPGGRVRRLLGSVTGRQGVPPGILAVARSTGRWSPKRWLPRRLPLRRRRTSAHDLTAFRVELHGMAKRTGLALAPLFAAITVAAFAVAFPGRLDDRLVLTTVEAVGAVPVGLFVGRALVYGGLGRRLVRAGFTVTAHPGHLDGAAGLAPIGELYFHQARLLAIPGLFLASWWLLIPLFGARYAQWRNPYLGQLSVVVVAEVLTFILPLLWFHRVMTERRRALYREADRLSRRSAETEHLEPAVAAAWEARFAAIERMATWPVRRGVRRQFGIGNLYLVVPILADVFGASEGLKAVLQQLAG